MLTVDKTMTEIEMYLAADVSDDLRHVGDITMEGYWFLDQGGHRTAVSDDIARFYLSGFLHEWFTDLGDDCWETIGNDRVRMVKACATSDIYFSALWEAYKHTERIEVK